MPTRPLTKGHPLPAVTTKSKKMTDRYIVMGIDFGVIRAAEFVNAIKFYGGRKILCHSQISGPNNPKIDTHNDIFVIFFEF